MNKNTEKEQFKKVYGQARQHGLSWQGFETSFNMFEAVENTFIDRAALDPLVGEHSDIETRQLTIRVLTNLLEDEEALDQKQDNY